MATETKVFPTNWQIGQEYDPNAHIMKIERYDKRSQRKLVADYLNVQNRLMWFIRDQRALIVAGLATCPYVIQTDLVEMDREQGWAHYKTLVRDVLGNEATMYGSEAAGDFPDFAEKASTKSLGRALLLMGYGTTMAPEMDEGERVVDTPVDEQSAVTTKAPTPLPATHGTNTTADDAPATDRQMTSITKLCNVLKRAVPATAITFGEARALLADLNNAYSATRQAS